MYTAYTYLITHKPTNKLYYGVRHSVNRKQMDPEQDLWVDYFTSSKAVHALIEEYGKDTFDIKIDRVFDTAEEAIAYEEQYLRNNLTEQYLNGNINGAVLPKQEYYDKISEYHKGKPKSEEHKRKISESNKGISSTWNSRPEYRAKMSAIMKGEGNGMFNKKHTEESKRKMSESSKGKPAWNKGIPISEEQREAISKRNKGSKRPQSAIDAAAEKNRGKKRPTKLCPQCNTSSPVNTYARWHGDNCKHR
jgi:hypothetical protein